MKVQCLRCGEEVEGELKPSAFPNEFLKKSMCPKCGVAYGHVGMAGRAEELADRKNWQLMCQGCGKHVTELYVTDEGKLKCDVCKEFEKSQIDMQERLKHLVGE